MVITTVLMVVVSRRVWDGAGGRPSRSFGAFAVIDLAFLVANGFKIADGGWFPSSWAAPLHAAGHLERGRILLNRRLASRASRSSPSSRASPSARRSAFRARDLHDGIDEHRAAGAAAQPQAQQGAARARHVPHGGRARRAFVPVEDRIQLKDLGNGFWRAEAWYGFKEQPDVQDILDSCKARYGLAFDRWRRPTSVARDHRVRRRAAAWPPGATMSSRG